MPATGDHTQEDLLSLLNSLQDSLELYQSTLEPSKLSEIETSKKDEEKTIDIEEELIKLGKLIFAHSTKIGIAFRAPVSINAAYAQLSETGQVFFILVGVVSLLYNNDHNDVQFGELYRSEILGHVRSLISLFKELMIELKSLDLSKQKGDVDESGRLMGIGKAWDSCEKLEALIKGGKLSLLKGKIKQSVVVTEDLIEEYEEWLQNPEIVVDPFGLNDDEEGEEEEEDKEVDLEVLEFGQLWISKVKMVKLLFSSFIKSLPSDNKKVTGKEIDLFNKEQNNFFNLVDDLVANVFLNSNIIELRAESKKIYSQSGLLIDLLKKLNKGDEKKTQWLSQWQDKFLLEKNTIIN